MRYPQNRKAETRQKLIEKAGSIAKKNGFATTGVDELMASVGLTGGAFYSHFASKDELLKAIIANELTSTIGRFMDSQNESTDPFLNLLELYLSPLHVQFPEMGCPLPSLSTEVARADTSTKQIYEDALKSTQQKLAHVLGNSNHAWAALALNIGGVVLSRAMASSETQQEVLNACKDFARNHLET
jgi:TetR/AcrR family transcriptional repressor of nem operon